MSHFYPFSNSSVRGLESPKVLNKTAQYQFSFDVLMYMLKTKRERYILSIKLGNDKENGKGKSEKGRRKGSVALLPVWMAL